ncbi:helix-hairpin-helix domain-containing protein [Kriegella sp. EG-1]|nr:helix-hairpin-helix domain-containing protein [Flavobacteriaceae bacterium EG-1]
MKKFKSHFTFSKQERSGIFFLLLFIVLVQLGYLSWLHYSNSKPVNILNLDTETQNKIELLKEKASQKDTLKIYPFNPNFITDYKGYALGLSVKEIDRLHNFRSGNNFVNSKEEFQQITKVSDSLLNEIAPYFKFPNWVKKNAIKSEISEKNYRTSQNSTEFNNKKNVVLYDLNLATVRDLQVINGIGEKLSKRIIKFRDRLGGFIVKEQLYHVYGLESEVVERLFKKFKIKTVPTVKKININEAAIEDLTKLVYFNYDLASEIVNYRDTNGHFISFDQLAVIEGFPAKKLDIIQLYLSLK